MSAPKDIIRKVAAITPEVYSSMGLTEGEYARIVGLLGREPNLTELGMFSVMWSEHCGYKYSRPLLKLFARYRESMEGGGLENAGIVDVGDGWGVAMKVESHNHPSAVEPYEGAATGVGGIIRDILSMGARPIALLNSLRFGPIRDKEGEPEEIDRNRYLFERVVAGIAGYGNCVGVPTVAGEVSFHRRYSGTPLVNAMCVGVVKQDEVATAAAKGRGNPVLYLGSSTGKDGIHGATFASETLGEDSDSKRPNVQIGDPFAEKSLIEATLEALETGAIVAIQDMGAAGLTCSTIEMSARGDVGMEIDLDKVPVRESGMTSVELMLSESQERMLAVVKKGREKDVIKIFHKWGLHANVVGSVNSSGLLSVKHRGEVVAHLDPHLLADKCPTYSTESRVPEYHRKALWFDPDAHRHPEPIEALKKLLSASSIASKRWVYSQYDHQVQTQTVVLPGRGDAAVLAPRGMKKAIAVKLDCNARQTYFDPFVGGKLAVCEAARNVACVGAMPVAVTDGLNFGNPRLPHVFWQFRRAVEGIAQACEALGTPVISGNVSFYNEGERGEVLPTPLIGMLGVLESPEHAVEMAPKSEFGDIALAYVPLKHVRQQGLGAGSYCAEVLNIEDGCPAEPDLEGEKRLCELLAQAAKEKLLDWAHDSSDGGLAVAAAEVAITGATGVEIDFTLEGLSKAFGDLYTPRAALFGEIPGMVLIGIGERDGRKRQRLQELAEAKQIGLAICGSYAKSSANLRLKAAPGVEVQCSVAELASIYEDAIPSIPRKATG